MILTEGGYRWQCPRPAEVFGYCGVHIPRHLYRIKYTWPNDHHTPGRRIRYRTEAALTHHPDRASVYTFEEACDIVYNKSNDARLVWGIVTTMEPVS
ncbi:MAG: hypothetical protein D6698_01785 [Gammaproteobacteria bacterium]|nr:MAG: hypothetical protein D6698_01785 [Gammaproteobacteria bacterium]